MKLSKLTTLTILPILITTSSGCYSSAKEPSSSSLHAESTSPTITEPVYIVGEKYTSIDIDLDGDGTTEKISCTFNKKLNDTLEAYTLNINGLTIEGDGYALEGAFGIVDIDSNDNYKEIVISDFGANDCTTTTFYGYDGKQIINMGTVPGLFFEKQYSNTIKVDGSGKISTLASTKLHFFWEMKVNYKRNNENKIELITQDLYEINLLMMVAKPFAIQTSKTSKDLITLKPGEKVRIVSTDNKEGFLIRTSNVPEGWLKVGKDSTLKSPEDIYEIFTSVTDTNPIY